MKVKIIGYERNAGFSKKKNANYDYHILYTQYVRPLASPASGYAVEVVPIDANAGILTSTPNPGETWELVRNRFGRIEEAYKDKV